MTESPPYEGYNDAWSRVLGRSLEPVGATEAQREVEAEKATQDADERTALWVLLWGVIVFGMWAFVQAVMSL